MIALHLTLVIFAGIGIPIAIRRDRADNLLPSRCSCLTHHRHIIHTLFGGK